MQTDTAAADVRRIILTFVPASWNEEDLVTDLPLGAEGLGLDSVALVELMLACERQWNVPFPPELLEQGPLTIGTLVDHLRRSRS